MQYCEFAFLLFRKCAKHTVQAEQTGSKGCAYRCFKDLVVGVVSRIKRDDVFIGDLVRLLNYFSYILSERAGYVSTGGYCLPDYC